MPERCAQSLFTRSLVLFLALFLVLASAERSVAHTPDSPVVKEMVAKGMAYLEAGAENSLDRHVQMLGGRCLLALAAMKSDRPNSPLIPPAVTACQKAVQNQEGLTGTSNYSLGLALIFLCELDPKKYRNEINALLAAMREKQRTDGAWSYKNHATGDTSQTQYGVLSIWVAHNSGYPASPESIAAVTNWLIRTQDPSGAFAYQGKDPGTMTRIKQPDLRYTMAPAGLGSLYMCADLLEISFEAERAAKNGLPDVVQKTSEIEKRGSGNTSVDSGLLKQGLADGNRWYGANLRIKVEKNQYYYLYSLERYFSFRESAEGDAAIQPAWYNQGVNLLADTQQKDGSWEGIRGRMISTAFALMFLLRSTQSTIQTVQDGLLVGGQGLPKKLKNLKVRDDGQVIDEDEKNSFDDVLKLIQESDSSAMSREVSLELARDKKERKSQVDELKQLVSGESYQARLAAVQTLARTGELDNVPVLIYALSDPDDRVTQAARDGLRFISRKFEGFGLSDNPSQRQKEKAQKDWAAWYRSIRPHAEFEYR